MPVAFLNLGPSEVALLLILFLLLFGVDRIPDIARSLGRARSEMERARREVHQALLTEEERTLEAQLDFERAREHQIRHQEEGDLVALRQAAEALGIQAEGHSAEELRRLIHQRVAGDGARPGGEESGENAAGAQQ